MTTEQWTTASSHPVAWGSLDVPKGSQLPEHVVVGSVTRDTHFTFFGIYTSGLEVIALCTIEKRSYRACRENAGYTAQVAATKLGVSITTLYSWEGAKTSPDAKWLPLMAKLYGCTIEDLLVAQ